MKIKTKEEKFTFVDSQNVSNTNIVNSEGKSLKRSRIDNLVHPWQPGQSGNPNGRPPGKLSLVGMLRKELEEGRVKDKSTGEIMQTALALVKTVIKKGLTDKNTDMLKDIIDRVDGKPSQPVDLNANIYSETIKQKAEELQELINKIKNDTKTERSLPESVKSLPTGREESK